LRYLFILILLPLCSLAKKNILFISVDDLKPSLGVYGDNYAITPHIDKLASFGTTFTNAHVQQAICAPSRVSLLTGLRPDLTEVWDLETQMRDKNPNILTLPQYFKENGYSTVGMGKIFDNRSVDRKLDQRSWSQPYIKVEVNHSIHGNSITGFQSPENKKILTQIRDKASEDGIPQGRMWQYLRSKFKPSIESFDISDDGYTDGVITLAAVSQLSKLSEKDDPFFLAVGFVKPHLPFVAPKKYWDMYNREEIKLAEYQKRARGTVKLSYNNNGEMRSYTDIPDSFDESGLINKDKQRELIHGYYACVSYIDAQIGIILDELEKNDLMDNTIIVLWGDHGWHLGDHGQWAKHSNFEQATRAPLIIVDPDTKSSNFSASPVEFIDVFPTLVELTGHDLPESLQGSSLSPILKGKSKRVKDFAVSQYPRGNVMGYAMRNERYRYVAWYKNRSTVEDDVIIKELYDYKNDPNETVNIVGVERELSERFQNSLNTFLNNQTKEKIKFKLTQNISKSSNITNNQPAVSSGINLLKNSGFENGTTGWNKGKGCPIYSVNNNARNGNSALMFEGTKCSIFQKVNGLKPNTTYKVSAYIKSENNEAALLKIRFYGGSDITRRYSKSEYGEVTTTFKTGPDNTSARIALLKYADGATGKTWFDDISVTEVGMISLSSKQNIKKILSKKFDERFYFGATISSKQLGTDAEKLLINNFNMTVPENAVKQARVHPDPYTWNWDDMDNILLMSEKNNLVVRLHGPVSPQSSHWAKNDNRTPIELEKNMNEYLIEQCKRYNGHPNVLWMDVVNETVERNGEWFGPKKGVDQWENPWTIIGFENDPNKTPKYIVKAFEIANEYAPNISLVYNQHGGMEKKMWEKVKETIIYLKGRGLRVDGLGWQAHLSNKNNINQEDIQFLSDLIDWCHDNELDFHVTEIDYKIFGEVNTYNQKIQADAYSSILKILLSKINNGIVTYNTWGIVDRLGEHTDKSRFIFDLVGNPKPAYFSLLKTLDDFNLFD
tara:strand:- start:1639 stop:4662 length:3024 start_codon:yes stop_codon:yes gene_type:complete